MDSLCKDIDSYEDFEKELNQLLYIKEIPFKKYSEYLNKHITSARLNLLVKLLEQNQIKI